MTENRVCALSGCNNDISNRRKDCLFCCDIHRVRAWNIKMINSEMEKRIASQAKASEEFATFLKHAPDFIECLHDQCQDLSEFYSHITINQFPFELIWNVCRYVGFSLRNSWRVPCKAYLKKNHPEICDLIKDI